MSVTLSQRLAGKESKRNKISYNSGEKFLKDFLKALSYRTTKSQNVFLA